MQKRRVNPTAIGVFVLGSLVIGIVSIVLFGSQRFFGGDRVSFVCLFEDDVDGMQIGSKVKLKGVPIGEVKQILIRFKASSGDEDPSKPLIPIIIEVNVDRLSDDLGVDMDFRDETTYRQQVRDGMRASLGMGNLITGILQVNVDYHEDADDPGTLEPFTYRGRVYRVIPTLPSQLAQATSDLLGVVNNISTADFKGVVDGLNELLVKVNDKLSQFEMKGMNDAVNSFKARMESAKIDEALDAFADAAESIRDATEAVKEVAEALHGQLGEEQLASMVQSADQTFQGVTEVSASVHELIEGSQSVPSELERSLQQLTSAVTEIKEFVSYLRERPNALIWGKKDADDAEAFKAERERKPWRAGPRPR